MLDVIKEYLVSLGFQVNSQSLNQAQNAMNQAERMITRFAGSSVTQFAVAGAAVTTFVAAANLAISRFMNNLAEAELRSQMFARQMYTTADNAMAVTNSLQSMGRSLEELYLSPELIKQFQELRQLSFKMRPPDEYREQMKFIRSIGFEFTKLKLEITYAMQWIGYYLFKYLEGPLKNIKLGMKDLNELIIKNMPNWTKQVAQVLSWVVRLGSALFTMGQTLYKVFTSIPTSLKVAGGAFMGFFTLLKMGPIGWIIAGLTSILLLIDDFTTYKKGGKSAFSGLWDVFDKLKENEGMGDAFTSIMDSIDKLLTSVVNLGAEIGKLLDKFAEMIGYKDIGELIQKGITSYLETLNSVIKSITDGVEALTKLLKGDFKGALSEVGEAFNFDRLLGIAKLFNPGAAIGSSIGGGIADYFSGKIPGYTTPKAQKNSFNTNQTNTFNVYGNDPYSTAQLVSSNMNSINTRNLKGVFI